MNIIIFNWRDPRNPKSGGAEIMTLEHAQAWVEAGYRVTWFAQDFTHAKHSEIFKGIEIIRKGNSVSVLIFALFFYLFVGRKFDIVIDQIHGFPFFTPLYVRRAKIIAMIHEVAGEIWDYMYPSPVNFLGRLFEKIMLVPYKNIPFITVSESTKKELYIFGIKKVFVIQNGLRFDTPVKKVAKMKHPTFIFVSRLVKMKGIEEVLKTFAYILKEYSDAHLLILGGGEENYINKLKQFAKDFSLGKHVHFYGRVDEAKKYELLRQSHILLHASVKEGWGLVVIEAASQGTPAVVYDVPGLRDSVKNKITGIIVKENTPRDMAEAAILLYKNKKQYQNLQKNCVQWANSLTWESAVKKSLSLLSSL